MKNYEKDSKLGYELAAELKKLGIDNPIKADMNQEVVSKSVHSLLSALGIACDDESIRKTPDRVARFFTDELFYGLSYDNFPKITFNHNSYNYNEPVISRNISFKSTCEHHLVTISGNAFVAYMPKDRVIGLSKINRIIDFFARRPQVQERATLQIFHALKYILQTDDIAVMIRATHHCITMRGVSDPDVDNITYQFGGKFSESQMKKEFLDLVKDKP